MEVSFIDTHHRMRRKKNSIYTNFSVKMNVHLFICILGRGCYLPVKDSERRTMLICLYLSLVEDAIYSYKSLGEKHVYLFILIPGGGYHLPTYPYRSLRKVLIYSCISLKEHLPIHPCKILQEDISICFYLSMDDEVSFY